MTTLEPFANVDDLEILWRRVEEHERVRAKELLSMVSHVLRVEARKVNKNLDLLVKDDESYSYLVKSVVIDIVARTLMTSTNQEPMTQFAESALGYSVSGSYLVPGGGLFIKDSELKRLGFKKQRYGVIDFYDVT
ncbi:phage protein Gp19/Gp15/Gp42 [Gemella bergeri ATCC 700627]|uniref:Phage protein Gp19/Gp15/Gp42 n=1 Tax=Gemella bergeri ATCC 700627 TaxID=1321820 RepID=U2RW81_9BACL|nr:phage Gp19/Gp15/Gp42 family protein [Gemella bergeri]ERK57828.1 phage protein Gp19/Gp15/Gp42 [Gemella bergeri ATCC 700627]